MLQQQKLTFQKIIPDKTPLRHQSRIYILVWKGIAEALQNMDLLNQITGMQISHNREMIEITIPDKEARIKIITEGLVLEDKITIGFRPDVPIIKNVSFFNIPL